MTPAATSQASSLGFLTIVESADLGLLGGYLLLNPAGRPVEFHCTAPVKPTRTQEILYGPTLKPFLYGEQIGQALLAKSKLAPVVVFTDSEPALATREFTQLPMALVREGEAPAEPPDRARQEARASVTAVDFSLAKSRVRTAAAFADDERAIRAGWPAQADQLDLLEPFMRIREALEEAQRAARQAA